MGSVHRPVSATEMTAAALRNHRGKVAFLQDGREITYDAVEDFIGRACRVLSDGGFGRGSGLAVLSGNRWDAWSVTVAAQMVGGRLTALHPLGSLEDHVYICDEAEIHTVLYDPEVYEARAAEIAERASTVKRFLSVGPSSLARDVLKLIEEAPSSTLRPDSASDDLYYVLYTGGTTGRPKGVAISHRAALAAAYNVLIDFDLPTRMRTLAASPITHAAGVLVGPTLMRGGTVLLHKTFDPDAFLRAIPEHDITMCFGVPTMIYVLLDHPVLEQVDLSSLEWFGYAASPMSPARLVEAIDRIGPVFVQFYGQTESAASGTILKRADHDVTRPDVLASCGKPGSTIRLTIQDDDNNPLPAGEIGEICVQGPAVMDGYWKQPELTAQTIVDDWLHTGDMAVRDDEGWVTIVDRKKDMIISGGFNVFPREVEDVLTSHPSVSMAAVIGVPDEKWGEAVKGVVVLKPGATVAPDELIALVREKKGPVYAPKSVDVVDAIPLTPIAKADKKALRAAYWQGEQRGVH